MGFSAAPLVSRPIIEPARSFSNASNGADAAVAPEIAFLSGIMSGDVLRLATRLASEIGVTAEAVLLSEGLISTDRFYRTFAAHFALPFAEKPLRPAATVSTGEVLASGIVELRANRDGWRFLAAPHGKPLRRFVELLRAGNGSQSVAVAITSPERLEALLRHERRHDIARHASHGLAEWNRDLSAHTGLTTGQALIVLLLAAAFCTAAWLIPNLCMIVVQVLFALAFLLAVCLRLLATAASPRPRQSSQGRRTPAQDLPTYSVIVPLFREARVVRRLVAALDRLDYPHAKLDVIFIVEANDAATLDAIDALRLPARYRTIMAPAGRPRTKPRALNVALQFARGSLVVIYDAEDDPEPAQLRDAARAFAADPDVACVQARLAIDNARDSWLSALFAIEYAALFHVVNPGLAALRLPIPLGGTSNHFRAEALRRANGWDAWNVTEDIDLGIRFARFKLRIGSLESDTFEEAPNTLKAWLKQRCRWMKGWMVTLGTHSRSPFRLWRDLGTGPTLAVAAMLFGTILSSLLGPFFVAILTVRAATGHLFWARSPYEAWWNEASIALLALGAVSAVWPALVGLRRRGALGLAPWLLLTPVYLLLLSIATWQAAVEVFGRPHAWNKTEHGLAKHRVGSARSA